MSVSESSPDDTELESISLNALNGSTLIIGKSGNDTREVTLESEE